jgi:hypothetical protein
MTSEGTPGVDSRPVWVRMAGWFLPLMPGARLPDSSTSPRTFSGHLRVTAPDAIRNLESHARSGGFEVRPRSDGLMICPPFQFGLSFWIRPALYVRLSGDEHGSRLEANLRYLGRWFRVVWVAFLAVWFFGGLVSHFTVSQSPGTNQIPLAAVFIVPVVMLVGGWFLDQRSRLSQSWNRAGLIALVETSVEKLSDEP